MQFSVGDRVQIIWNGPPTVWKIWNVIKTPPPRWAREPFPAADGKTIAVPHPDQISYCLMKDSDKYPGTIDIPEEKLKHVS